MTQSCRLIPYTLMILALTGCGEEDDPESDPADATPPSVVPASDPCQRGALEADLASAGPLAGAGVDPETGKLLQAPEGGFIVSSTYLRLKPEASAQRQFGELVQGISEALATQPGLLAIELASSQSCGTARTLSVWRDEEAMFAFVASPAHTAAMAAVSEVSRGGSITTHWSGRGEADASWDKAAQTLAVSTRREY